VETDFRTDPETRNVLAEVPQALVDALLTDLFDQRATHLVIHALAPGISGSYQDGVIEYEIKITGIMSTAVAKPGLRPSHGQPLNPDGLYGPIHQHVFNVRLDMMAGSWQRRMAPGAKGLVLRRGRSLGGSARQHFWPRRGGGDREHCATGSEGGSNDADDGVVGAGQGEQCSA
jgi:Copper amine oxidase, enzyme domain